MSNQPNNKRLLFRYSSEAGFRFRCITHDLFEDAYVREKIDVYGEDLNDGDRHQNVGEPHARPHSRGGNFKVSVVQPRDNAYGVSYQVQLPKDECNQQLIAELETMRSRSPGAARPTFSNPSLEFDVFLAGELVYSKRETGRFPLSRDIFSKIR